MRLLRRFFHSSAALPALALLGIPCVAFADTMQILNENICVVGDTPGLVTLQVTHSYSPHALASRFRIAADAGVTMTYVSESHPFANSLGNTQTGLTVCYGECMPGSFVVAEVTYMRHGTSGSCNAIRVLPHPDAETLDFIDCNNDARAMSTYPIWVMTDLGGCVGCIDHRPPPEYYPGAPEWFSCVPLKSQATTWGKIKALYTEDLLPLRQ